MKTRSNTPLQRNGSQVRATEHLKDLILPNQVLCAVARLRPVPAGALLRLLRDAHVVAAQAAPAAACCTSGGIWDSAENC